MKNETIELLKACVEYRAMVDKLETENAALREERDALKAALEYEVVDTERLHWLLVDRIKKEAQP